MNNPSLSQTSVLKLYKAVIEDTIASSRDAFLDENVDEQVLMELKHLWETKVTNNKAVQVDPPTEVIDVAPSTSTNRKNQPVKRNNELTSNNSAFQQNSQSTAIINNSLPQQQLVTNGTSAVATSVTNNTTTTIIQQSQTQSVIPSGVAGGGSGSSSSTSSNANNSSSTNSSVINNVQQTNTVQSQQAAQNIFTNMLDPTKIVPIQITLPPQPGVQEAQSRVLTIQVPATALMGNQLQQVLTGPVISATMSLPQPQASNLLQQHVNAALQGQNSPLLAAKAIPQVDGIVAASDDEDDEFNSNNYKITITDIFALARAIHSTPKQIIAANSVTSSASRQRQQISRRCTSSIHQLDGVNYEDGLLDDSSDEDDDVSEEPSEDEENDDDREDEDPDIDEGGMEEEPLNSEDDVSEEDPSDLFDTENVVVCQYDKINRSRNKWKFYLKDGIMNLNGKDFIFQKITGDAEW